MEISLQEKQNSLRKLLLSTCVSIRVFFSVWKGGGGETSVVVFLFCPE